MSGYPNSISSRDASGPKVEPDPTSLWTAESRAKRAKARLDSLRAQEDEDIRNIDRRRDDRIARVKARFTSEEERISNSKSYAEAKADAAWERARQSRDRASEFDRRSSYDISRIRDGRRAWESYYAEIRRIQDTLGTERERCRQDRSKNRDDETTAMNRIYAESREETLKVREALQAADKESVEADKKLALAKLEFSRAEKHRSESEIEEKAAQDEKAAAESANASDEAKAHSK
ncbi:unnamed protein product [Amoebophrya sp. A25]|nr:unnamed protein product [Amoebophrya sp. A25]|eukprot:GSA25T00003716001.1